MSFNFISEFSYNSFINSHSPKDLLKENILSRQPGRGLFKKHGRVGNSSYMVLRYKQAGTNFCRPVILTDLLAKQVQSAYLD